jgi:hypothetical protein
LDLSFSFGDQQKGIHQSIPDGIGKATHVRLCERLMEEAAKEDGDLDAGVTAAMGDCFDAVDKQFKMGRRQFKRFRDDAVDYWVRRGQQIRMRMEMQEEGTEEKQDVGFSCESAADTA